MNKDLFIIFSTAFIATLLLSFSLFAEEIKCPKDNILTDLVLSFSKERMQVCQKKVDGKYLKDGVEIIYKEDGTIKSTKYFKMDVEVDRPDETSIGASAVGDDLKKCPNEAVLLNNNCVPKSGVIWKGKYSCPKFQGETELLLTMGTDDSIATFDFVAKKAKGKYTMKGKFDPEKNQLTLVPIEWIVKPETYFMIGMIGTVNFEDHTYKGKMTGCALFDLKAQ